MLIKIRTFQNVTLALLHSANKLIKCRFLNYKLMTRKTFSHVFLHTIDEDSHKKLSNMDDYHRRKYWRFWINAKKGEMVTKTGRPRFSGLNVSLATIIPLTLWQMDRTIQGTG